MFIKSIKQLLFQSNLFLKWRRYWKKSVFPSLDHLIYLFSLENETIYFVQIGAHSGQITDPLYQYIRLDQWQGIMVEPQGALFKKLQNRFGENRNIILENVAISDENGHKPFYFLKPKPNSELLPEWVDQLAGFHKKVPSSVIDQLPNAEIDRIDLKCMTLNSLFEKNNVQQLDLLMVDTEGHDYVILQRLNFAKYSPKMIVFEHCFLNKNDDNKCLNLLKTQGYFIYRDGFNTVAFYSNSICKIYANHLI